jgi:hypothetical protein
MGYKVSQEGVNMAKLKRLSKEGFHIRFAKEDIDWIQQEPRIED